MRKLAFTTITTAALMLVFWQAPASARICARYCQGGVCWTDCSKIPGQTHVTAQTNASIPGPKPTLGTRRATGRR